MNTVISKQHSCVTYKILSCFVAVTFFLSMMTPSLSYAQVQPNTVLDLPVPGAMVNLSEAFKPTIIKGMSFYPDNPLEFDFIVDVGDARMTQDQLKEESNKLIKYFLASLTVPEEEMWVNLSPYENDRIIPGAFGVTEMGRDLLAQDYMLKQLTASLIYPEQEIGEEFWDTVYERAYQEYGSVNIPVNTFNKIWIVPKDAVVAEKDNEVYVLNKHLKVMLEEDYVALQHSMGIEEFGLDSIKKEDIEKLSGVSADVVREILIPAIEKEINTGENFAQLRQIYNSMILATWFKKNLKESLLGKVYVDQNKVKGVDVDDKQIKQKIYNQYVEAFKKGVYNYVKEDYDPTTQQVIPRKYFSGGAVGLNSKQDYKEIDFAIATSLTPDQRNMAEKVNRELRAAEDNKTLVKVKAGLFENAAGPDFAIAVNSASPQQPVATVVDDIRALQKEFKELKSVATIDPLSQLPNRAAYYSDVLKRIQQIQDGVLGRRSSDNRMVVYTADINEFKFFNEMFGHDVGDEVLKGVGTLINSKVQGDHIFARTGGEEFYGTMSQVELKEVNAFLEGLSADLVSQTQSRLIFPSLNNSTIVKRVLDEKVEAISQDIVQAIDKAVEKNELPQNYDKKTAIASAKQTGIFDSRYQKYMKEDLSKIKNGLIHQFVFQGITDAQGKTLSAQEWNQKGIYSLLNLASEKMNRVDVTISSGATLFEGLESDGIPAERSLARLMKEADVAMYRSKENKNVQISTVAFNQQDRGMARQMQQADLSPTLAQISSSLSGTVDVQLRTDFFEMSPEEIEARAEDVYAYREQMRKDVDKLKSVSLGDVVAGPGIYNRRGLENQMNKMMTQMRQLQRAQDSVPGERRSAQMDRRQRLQFVSLDLGDLGVYNNTFGHDMGDKLLSTFAQTAKKTVGEFGPVGRYGGDEFAIIFQGSQRDVETTLRNIYDQLLQSQEFNIASGELRAKLQSLKGDAREKFLKAVRRQIVMQREELRASGQDIDMTTLMNDAQLENIPMDILTSWKPVFSAGIASYDANIMRDWSVDQVQKTLSIASDKAQEQAKTEMRSTGTFVVYTAKDLNIDLATVRQDQDYALTTAFNQKVTNQYATAFHVIKANSEQPLIVSSMITPHSVSISNVIGQLAQRGVIDQRMNDYAQVWSGIRESGYREAVDFNDPVFERNLKSTWSVIGEALGYDAQQVSQFSNQAYDLLRDNSDQTVDPQGYFFVNKVIGRAPVEMAINMSKLMDKGLPRESAVAISILSAVRHAGAVENIAFQMPQINNAFPAGEPALLKPLMLADMEPEFRTLIVADYVSTKSNNAEVTNIVDLRQQYEAGQGQKIVQSVASSMQLAPQDLADVFTSKGKQSTIAKIASQTGLPVKQVSAEIQARTQASANYLRMKIADYVADNLGVMDRAEARSHVLLGYGLEHVTSSIPGGFSRNAQSGIIESVQGEIFDSKYPLIASMDIPDYNSMTIDQVYERSIVNVEQEMNTFVNTVEDMKVGLDSVGIKKLEALKQGVVNEGNNAMAQARINQNAVSDFVNKYLRNSNTISFSGHLRDVGTDIAIVDNLISSSDFQTNATIPEKQAAAYLLRSLKALNAEEVINQVTRLRNVVADMEISKTLPAQTTLSPEEVFSQWVLIGGEENEVRIVMDVLQSEQSQSLEQALTALRAKVQQEQRTLDLDRADHLLRVAHGSIAQALRDGENREALFKKAEDFASATKQKRNTNVGGINLNASLLDLQIQRDEAGVPLPAFQQPVGNMKIDGFLPVIIDIAPIQNVPLFLSYNDDSVNPGV